jgi:hypothetical protein
MMRRTLATLSVVLLVVLALAMLAAPALAATAIEYGLIAAERRPLRGLGGLLQDVVAGRGSAGRPPTTGGPQPTRLRVEVTGLPSDVVAHVEGTGAEECREPADADDPALSAVPRQLR